ncbi:MAG: hypothetical protein F6K32_16490 [Desertifilum sp. SIO1I2]|nr:hypothetical protein [Desertifilum sp. SIO1I2]
MRLANRVRVGFALFVLLSSLLGLGGCAVQARGAWQPVNQVVTPEILEQVIIDQTNATASEQLSLIDNAQAWVIPGNVGQLVFINYNTPKLCGLKQCLYTGLWKKPTQEWEIVFSLYLDRNLPQSVPLFEAPIDEPSSIKRPLPCFRVNQLESTTLRQTLYCLSENQYQLIRTTTQTL